MVKRLRKFADNMAQRIADFMGSWQSVVWFLTVTCSWVALNLFVCPERYRIDPYPFHFLNFILGVMAAITGPLVVIGNRLHEKRYQKMIESIYTIEKKQDEFLTEVKERILAKKKTKKTTPSGT